MSNYKVDIPEGGSGEWAIRKVTVSEEQGKLDELRAMFGGHGRFVPAGTYTQLIRGKTIVMSDTPDEIDDLWGLIYNAKGNVLINGLGLGVALQGVLNKPEVSHVTVIEFSPDVINLVGSFYKQRYDGRLEIINADALSWRPPKGARYNAVWHDIWDTVSGDNLPQMHKLHRRYGRITDWQDSWCRWLCERDR